LIEEWIRNGDLWIVYLYVTTKKYGIKDALAADDHFVQAEFKALLLEK